MPTTTESGYTFDGWYTAATGGTKISSTTKVTGTTTYYAHWTPANYTITYNNNAGKNYIDSAGSSIEITGFTGSTNRCVNLGTIDKGDLKSGDKLQISFKASYTGLTAASGQTASVLAQGSGDVTGWSPEFPRGTRANWLGTGTTTYSYTTYAFTTSLLKNNNYTIQLRTDYYTAGTITITDVRVTRATGITTTTASKAFDSQLGTLPTPTESGYTLDGWYTAADGGTKISSTTTVRGDTTYYAHWIKNNYEELNSSGTHVKYYETLASAMSGVTSGNTVKVLKSRTENDVATLGSGKTVTFNLNGKYITTTTDITTLINNGTLTVQDSVGSGYIKNTSTKASKAIIENTGKLSLSGSKDFVIGGKSTQTSQWLINNKGGSLVLSKGTLQQEGALSGEANRYAIYSSSGGNVTISGVTIKTTSSSTTTNDNGIVFYGNNTLNMTSGTITTKGIPIVSYGSLTSESAPAVKVTGGTIESTGNYGISNEGGGLVYINGSSASITGSKAGMYSNSAGSFKVNNGTINSTSDGIYIRTGSLTVSGGTVKGDNSAITNAAPTTINITGGTVNGANVGLNLNAGNALISGGEITAGGTTSDGTSVTEASCIVNSGYGKVTITSGTIKPQVGSNYAINNKAGTIEVLGGTVHSNMGGTAIKATKGTIVLGSKTSQYEGAYVDGYIAGIDLCDSTEEVTLELGASTDTTVDTNTDITARRPYINAKGTAVKGDSSTNIKVIFRNGSIRTYGGNTGSTGGGTTRIYPFLNIPESQITAVNGYFIQGMGSVVMSETLTYLRPNSEKSSDEVSDSDVAIHSGSSSLMATVCDTGGSDESKLLVRSRIMKLMAVDSGDSGSDGSDDKIDDKANNDSKTNDDSKSNDDSVENTDNNSGDDTTGNTDDKVNGGDTDENTKDNNGNTNENGAGLGDGSNDGSSTGSGDESNSGSNTGSGNGSNDGSNTGSGDGSNGDSNTDSSDGSNDDSKADSNDGSNSDSATGSDDGEKSDNSDTVVVELQVAQINDKKYSSISQAIDAAVEGDTITILDNMNLTDEVNIGPNKNINLKLNGKTITSTSINSINNNGTLTISGPGVIKNDSANGTVIYNTGMVNIENEAVITTSKNGGKGISSSVNGYVNGNSAGNQDGKSGILNMKSGKIVTEGIGSIGIYNIKGAVATVEGGIVETRGSGSKGIYNDSKLNIGKSDNNATTSEAGNSKVKIIVSDDDSIGIYNAKNAETCVIKGAEITVQAENIENYELIKNTNEFKAKLEAKKPSYGIYNDSKTDVTIETAVIKVERLKGVGIKNNFTGSITLGKEDNTINIAVPIIYAIADNTTAIENSEKGQICFYDGKIISISSVKDLFTKLLQNSEVVEEKGSSNVVCYLKKVVIE